VILLDTHAWVWLVLEPKKLSHTATQSIRRALRGDGIAIASISLLEVAWLFANGRLRSSAMVGQSVSELVDGTGVQCLELTPEIAATAVQLPASIPADPVDRLIVATALVNGLPLVTRDGRIRDARACNVVW